MTNRENEPIEEVAIPSREEEKVVLQSYAFLYFPDLALEHKVALRIPTHWLARARQDLTDQTLALKREDDEQFRETLTSLLDRDVLTSVPFIDHVEFGDETSRLVFRRTLAQRYESFSLGLALAKHWPREDIFIKAADAFQDRYWQCRTEFPCISISHPSFSAFFQEAEEKARQQAKKWRDFAENFSINLTYGTVYKRRRQEIITRFAKHPSLVPGEKERKISIAQVIADLDSFLESYHNQTLEPTLSEKWDRLVAQFGLFCGLIARNEMLPALGVFEQTLQKESQLLPKFPISDLLVGLRRPFVELLAKKVSPVDIDRLLNKYDFFLAVPASGERALRIGTVSSEKIEEKDNLFLPRDKSLDLLPDYLSRQFIDALKSPDFQIPITSRSFLKKVQSQVESSRLSLKRAKELIAVLAEGVKASDEKLTLTEIRRSLAVRSNAQKEAYLLGLGEGIARLRNWDNIGLIIPVFENLAVLIKGNKELFSVQATLLRFRNIITSLYQQIHQSPNSLKRLTALSDLNEVLAKYHLLCYTQRVPARPSEPGGPREKEIFLLAPFQEVYPELKDVIMFEEGLTPKPLGAEQFYQARRQAFIDHIVTLNQALHQRYASKRGLELSRETPKQFLNGIDLGLRESWLFHNQEFLQRIATEVFGRAESVEKEATETLLSQVDDFQEALADGLERAHNPRTQTAQLLRRSQRYSDPNERYFFLNGAILGLCAGRNFPRLRKVESIIQALAQDPENSQEVQELILKSADILVVPLSIIDDCLGPWLNLPSNFRLELGGEKEKVRVGNSKAYKTMKAVDRFLANYGIHYISKREGGKQLGNIVKVE